MQRDGFAALATLHRTKIRSRDPSGVHVLLRVYDHKQDRGKQSFRDDWRAFLGTWNLLQFLPDCEVVTTEGLSPSASVEEAPSTPSNTKHADAELEHIPEELLDLVIAVQSTAGLPIVGYELMLDDAIAAEAELAWEQSRVAVLLESQQDDAPVFARSGWRTCPPDASRLQQLLQEPPSSATT